MRPVWLGLAPLFLLLCGARSLPHERAGERTGQRQVFEAPRFRTVVLILDSVGTPMAFDPALMPFVSSLTSSSLFGEARACPGKATFPCVKSIFEGRTATTGTTLQDFSAVASQRTTWPASLAALGHRIVVTSDHTLTRLYPDAFVDSMNYETLDAPLLERDGYAYRQAEKWLADPSIDVLILHIIGTDKVAHEYPVGGPVYREKYLEVDRFVREVAARLGPRDYLYVLSDHGHNELGGHTEDAAYLAHGPLFPQGRHENLGAADMLFLLSAPYGLTLPDQYEGHVRTDLTLMPDDLREELLSEQARLWRIPHEGISGSELEARLNQHSAGNRQEEQRKQAIATIRRLAPWLLAAALFLLAELKLKHAASRPNWLSLAEAAVIGLGLALGLAALPAGAWLVALGMLSRCVRRFGGLRTLGALCLVGLLGAIAFWLAPMGLEWFHNRKNQPMAWAVFYPAALAAGLGVTFSIGAPSPRRHAARVLWTVGVALWLLAYFGPYNYALTGRGAKVVLGLLAPIAIILAGGFRTCRSFFVLCWLGLIPFLTFHTESFNIEYRLLDRITEMPVVLGYLLCALAGAFLILALGFAGARERRSRSTGSWMKAALLFAAWLFLSGAFFQFELGKLTGILLGSLWLAGCLELFRRAELPSSWSALAGAVVLFLVFHFVLDGFALSHVDFRFAANKIIPFQEEAFRAPQLILWVVVKYLFGLIPPLSVLFFAARGTDLGLRLLQFGWWRELMIGLSALGLSIYDRRGVSELCGEEIYFWTFLSLVLWFLCLAVVWADRRAEHGRLAW